MLIAILCAVVVALAPPAQAFANENFSDEPPFGGQLPPKLVRPPTENRPPAGFRLSGRQAIAIANRAAAVRDERTQSPSMRPVAFERGANWQVNYYVRGSDGRTEVAEAIVEDSTGAVLGAWHDLQLSNPLARGYSGVIAQ